MIDWMVTSSAHSVLAGITYGQRGVVLFNPRLNLSEVSRRRVFGQKLLPTNIYMINIYPSSRFWHFFYNRFYFFISFTFTQLEHIRPQIVNKTIFDHNRCPTLALLLIYDTTFGSYYVIQKFCIIDFHISYTTKFLTIKYSNCYQNIIYYYNFC